MKIECAYDELVLIENIIESPKNYNKHSARQIEMLAKIINFNGQRSPLVVSKRSGFLVCGAGRLMAIKKLGWPQVAVDYQDFENEAAEHAHMIADNKISELAETNQEMLLDLGLTLGMDFDQELLGLDIDLFKTELPEVIEHEGLDNLKITIRECPHCKESFEESTAKIIG